MTNRHIFPLTCDFRAKVRLLLLMLLTATATVASAFDAGYYPTESVLASGRWVKVSVERDGLYGIPGATLRSWGFSDPERVRVFGAGGHRMSDEMTERAFFGDLPPVQAVVEDGTLIFYAQGPGQWVESTNGFYHYETNVYATAGYYYLTESDEPAPEIGHAQTMLNGRSFTEYYNEFLHHELESFSPGDAGPLLLGEDFRYSPTHFFDFPVSDLSPYDGNLWFETSFVNHSGGAGTSLAFTVNGAAVASLTSDNLPGSVSSQYTHGLETVSRHANLTLDPAATTLRIGITLKAPSMPRVAALNYLSVNYRRRICFRASGAVEFTTPYAGVIMAENEATIWDVTDPRAIEEVSAESEDGTLRWSRPTSRTRTYAAWRRGASLPQPKYEGAVQNQNLHSLEDVDMVIVCPREWLLQGERIAQLHRTDQCDPLNVAVVTPEEIYNEFSSGTPQPGGLRNFFKMLYDRGAEGARPFRYALLMGRMTIDNRHLLKAYGEHPTIPGWSPPAPRASLNDNEGYFTDDVTAMLDDGSGANLKTDKLSIAIGRMPMTDLEGLRNVVDKTIEYAANRRRNAWGMRALFLADDGDGACHVTQTETQISNMQAPENSPFMPRRVYIDAFERVGSTFPQARETLFRYLDEGVVWWNYVGHANTVGLTGDGMVTYNDLNTLYLRQYPFIYAATCNFMRMDAPGASGAELVYAERYGGCIGVISALRPVYIPDNGNLSAAMGRAMANRDHRGLIPTPGEIYRQAKNDIRDGSGNPRKDDNRLRYAFVGDPALRLVTPARYIRIDQINGVPVGGDTPVELAARQQCTVTGTVLDPLGNELPSFSGTVTVDIFDAERSVTTLGYNNGETTTFEDYGDRVFCGSAPVSEGRFTLNVAMPMEIAQNYRPGTMLAYAVSDSDNDDAGTLFRDFYIYGLDEEQPDDTNPPVIEEMFLNHSDFIDGGTVGTSPMLIARISDDTGINLSTAGIGHGITAVLDDKTSMSDLQFFYTPNADGTPGGMINYPMEGITEGDHTLRLRVWDTSGNSARREISFRASGSVTPKIYDIYSDANPASTVANFYLTHDQPDAMVTVTVEVFNLMGRRVWTGSTVGRSDMLKSVPVSWDLTDIGGARVPRGIYVYRAQISIDGEHYETGSRRLAVTAQ